MWRFICWFRGKHRWYWRDYGIPLTEHIRVCSTCGKEETLEELIRQGKVVTKMMNGILTVTERHNA